MCVNLYKISIDVMVDTQGHGCFHEDVTVFRFNLLSLNWE